MEFLDEQLTHIVQTLEQCEHVISNSLVMPLADAAYLESGTFGTQPFLLRVPVAKKLTKEGIRVQERYSLSDYVHLLTSYVIAHKCVDAQGLITPTPFLRTLFKISPEPCSLMRFLELATIVFV